jgi:hypothetical protein
MKDKYAQNGMNQLDYSLVSKDEKKHTRLPCRGCIASCKNYHCCDGKLWRMNQ